MELVKNEVVNISSVELSELLMYQKKENVLIVNLDGQLIQDEFMFVDEMEEKFELPDNSYYFHSLEGVEREISWDNFCSEMTDLYEFAEDMHFIIIISHFEDFLKDDLEIKEMVLDILENTCRYWKKQEEYPVDGGRIHTFTVYLVD